MQDAPRYKKQKETEYYHEIIIKIITTLSFYFSTTWIQKKVWNFKEPDPYDWIKFTQSNLEITFHLRTEY